jgi:dTDP-4-amino-4,6-dideoxy-D-galactose acyltransferase
LSVIERLDWDSEFFGFPIGKVNRQVGSADLERATREADKTPFRCIYMLVSASDHDLLDVAQKHGFLVRDIRVQFERSVEGHRSNATGMRPGSLKDLPKLSLIARDRFCGTRFFADHGFPADRSAELYVEWLSRGLRCEDDRVSLVTDDSSGFVTCHLDHDSGVGAIELIAVSHTATKKGIGSKLVAGAGMLFVDHLLATARVITQGHNIAAQRLYQAHGYRTTSVDLWLHRWRA